MIRTGYSILGTDPRDTPPAQRADIHAEPTCSIAPVGLFSWLRQAYANWKAGWKADFQKFWVRECNLDIDDDGEMTESPRGFYRGDRT